MKANYSLQYFQTNKLIITKYQKGIEINRRPLLSVPKLDENDFELFTMLGSRKYTIVKNIFKREIARKRTTKMVNDYVNNAFLVNHSFWYFTFNDDPYINRYDIKAVKKATTEFVDRLRYNYYEKQLTRRNDLRYLIMFEQHHSGAWHVHAIFNTRFSNQDLSKLWGHGWCNAKNIHNTKNLGGYVSKYLTKTFSAIPKRFRSFIRSKNLTLSQKKYALDCSNEYFDYAYKTSYYSSYHGVITKYYFLTNVPDTIILKLLTSFKPIKYGKYNAFG